MRAFPGRLTSNSAQMMFRARNNLLPKHSMKERIKSNCITVNGVKLCNKMSMDLKLSKNIFQFKKKYKETTFAMCTNEERPFNN